jgi:hypothetical protein
MDVLGCGQCGWSGGASVLARKSTVEFPFSQALREAIALGKRCFIENIEESDEHAIRDQFGVLRHQGCLRIRHNVFAGK